MKDHIQDELIVFWPITEKPEFPITVLADTDVFVWKVAKYSNKIAKLATLGWAKEDSGVFSDLCSD